jgi:hypothetical protein
MRRDVHQPVGQPQRRLERLRQALLGLGPDLEAVDHDVDVVLELAVELRRFLELEHLVVDARAHEALRAHLLEHLDVLALAAAHHRRQQHPGRLRGQGQHLVHHLRHALRFQRDTVVRAARHADAREQQAQVIVDLGDGADGRARVVRGGFLLDRNGRRQALDRVHVGLLHHRQELPGVGGE